MEMPTYKPKVEGWDLKEWAMKHKGFADQAVPKWTAAVKEKYGKEVTKFASLGYCFGAPFVFETLGSGVADVGAFAHPTFLTDSHFEKLSSMLPNYHCCVDAHWAFQPVLTSVCAQSPSSSPAVRTTPSSATRTAKRPWIS